MPEVTNNRLEDVECSILNSAWISTNQHNARAQGVDYAHLRSPGLKVQVLKLPGVRSMEVYCERHDRHTKECAITGDICIYSE